MHSSDHNATFGFLAFFDFSYTVHVELLENLQGNVRMHDYKNSSV